MDNSIAAPQLLKPPEAAKALAISERKLWDLTKRGEIPCVRIDRCVRYDQRDLATWIESHRHRPGTRRLIGCKAVS